jgi:hypothetical protein
MEDKDKSVGELDEEILKLELELEKHPTKEAYDRMISLMKICNKKTKIKRWQTD